MFWRKLSFSQCFVKKIQKMPEIGPETRKSVLTGPTRIGDLILNGLELFWGSKTLKKDQTRPKNVKTKYGFLEGSEVLQYYFWVPYRRDLQGALILSDRVVLPLFRQ